MFIIGTKIAAKPPYTKISVMFCIIKFGLYTLKIANINAKMKAIDSGINAENATDNVSKTARKNQSFHKFIFLNFINK